MRNDQLVERALIEVRRVQAVQAEERRQARIAAMHRLGGAAGVVRKFATS